MWFYTEAADFFGFRTGDASVEEDLTGMGKHASPAFDFGKSEIYKIWECG